MIINKLNNLIVNSVIISHMLLAGCTSEQSYLERGNKRYDSGEYDLAISNYNWAIEKNPKNPAAYYFRGLANNKKNNKLLALQDISNSIELSGGFVQAYVSRASIFSDLERFDSAIKDYESALKLRPGDLEIQALLADSLFDAGNYLAAEQFYTELIQRSSQKSYLYRERGDVLYKMQLYERAISDYKKSLDIDSIDHYAMNNLAWLLATCIEDEFRDGALAVNLSKKAIELNPTETNYDTYAAALAEIGEYSKAVSILEDLKAKSSDKKRIQQRIEKYNANQPLRIK